MNVFGFQLIPGFMLGIEWQYEHKLVVVDLLIVRLLFYYNITEGDMI